MSAVEPSSFDLIGSLIGFGFTLVIFSYVFGDNVLFRLAVSIFVGVATGFAGVMVWKSVILPKLIFPILTGDSASRFQAIIPLLLGILLLLKGFNRTSGWGSPVVALLIGVGAATILGGAVLGTLFPQISTSIELPSAAASTGNEVEDPIQYFNAFIILLSTLSTLLFFQFGARRAADSFPTRSNMIHIIANIGKVFIAITFGVIFAGVYKASLTALVDRVIFSMDVLMPFIHP